jgi:hypothetical protein
VFNQAPLVMEVNFLGKDNTRARIMYLQGPELSQGPRLHRGSVAITVGYI